MGENNNFMKIFKLIFCFVTKRYTAIIPAAKIALYNASSPELTEMFLVNSPKVPKIAMEMPIIPFGFTDIFNVLLSCTNN